MSKRAKKPAARGKKARQEWPLVVYLWIFGLAVMGYLIGGELLLATRPHPLHWAVGVTGGLVGIPIGWLWYRWRGDVI
ncbi:MAG: hypothetical protein AB1449_10795 [Chloroflexota bacterium]